MDERDLIVDLTTKVAVLTDRLVILSQNHTDTVLELRRQMETSNNNFNTIINELKKTIDEQSKNYVLQVEFGFIRYLVLTVGLGFLVQAVVKFLFKW